MKTSLDRSNFNFRPLSRSPNMQTLSPLSACEVTMEGNPRVIVYHYYTHTHVSPVSLRSCLPLVSLDHLLSSVTLTTSVTHKQSMSQDPQEFFFTVRFPKQGIFSQSGKTCVPYVHMMSDDH